MNVRIRYAELSQFTGKKKMKNRNANFFNGGVSNWLVPSLIYSSNEQFTGDKIRERKILDGY